MAMKIRFSNKKPPKETPVIKPEPPKKKERELHFPGPIVQHVY